MVSINKLTVDFGGFLLFNEVSFLINAKDRIGLVGKNGAGKSTLLKIIAGLMPPTSGSVALPKDFTIGYLPQHMKHTNTRTVSEEVELAFEELKKIEKDIDKHTALYGYWGGGINITDGHYTYFHYPENYDQTSLDKYQYTLMCIKCLLEETWLAIIKSLAME